MLLVPLLINFYREQFFWKACLSSKSRIWHWRALMSPKDVLSYLDFKFLVLNAFIVSLFSLAVGDKFLVSSIWLACQDKSDPTSFWKNSIESILHPKGFLWLQTAELSAKSLRCNDVFSNIVCEKILQDFNIYLEILYLAYCVYCRSNEMNCVT